MSVFDFNIKKYALLLTPPFKRSPVWIGFLSAAVRPLSEMYQKFLEAREQNLIRMRFNYQVCSLEYRLNDAFDPVERRIYISKAVIYDGVFLYTEAEDDAQQSKTKWLNNDSDPIFLRMDMELNSDFDVVVKIPYAAINQIRLSAEIDYYKLPSKRYSIELIP